MGIDQKSAQISLYLFWCSKNSFTFSGLPLKQSGPLDGPLDKTKPSTKVQKRTYILQKRTHILNEFREKTVEIDKIHQTMWWPNFVYIANIFNIIFTVFKGVQLSTVISLHVWFTFSDNRKAEWQFSYCNFYIGL